MNRLTSSAGALQKCFSMLRGLRSILATARCWGQVQATSDRALRVEEKLSLGPKKMLYLVRCREKEFLVAMGTDAIVTMIEIASEKQGQMPNETMAKKRERIAG